MSTNRAKLADALRRTATANAALCDQLQDNAELLRRSIALVESDAGFGDGLEALPVHTSITATSAAETDLFDARQALRRAVVWVALDDGMSVERLAQMFGVSVDLISSYAAANPARMTRAV